MPVFNQEKPEEEKDFTLRWYKVRNRVKEDFGQRPDINAMLFLIGINELGMIKDVWEKEEKQNLIHIAVCKLFETEGYFKFMGKDEDGWPHWIGIKGAPKINIKEQEQILKRKIVEYFENNL